MASEIAELDNYYLKHPEPIQGCLLALKSIILGVNKEISHERIYQIPFFCYKGKKLCFLWVNRKKLLLGFVEDKSLFPKIPGVRSKDQFSTMIIDPNADLPLEIILKNLQDGIAKYERL